MSNIHIKKTVVFYDPEYPQLCTEAALHQLVPGPFQIAGAADLAEHLGREYSLFLSFHGPYFPKTAWRALLGFLENGSNMAIFGGMPFARPVDDDGTIEPEQDSYTRQIYLGPFYQLSPTSGELQFVTDEDATLLYDCSFQISADAPGIFWSFYPKLTQVDDHPEDLGSAGPLDTILQPLIYAQSTTSTGKTHREATPALLLDQRSGRFKGGRWLISAWRPAAVDDWLANAEVIKRLIALAGQGATSFEVRPALGCYQPGEAPSLVVTARTDVELQARLLVRQPGGEVLQTFDLVFPASPVQQVQECKLSPRQEPGLYHIEGEYHPSDGQRLALASGFWIWDEDLIAATGNKRLSAGRDYFYQEDQPFLVFGTTYMDGRVQRKFLHLPNPARWDKEMGAMKEAGINLIRTGVWTAWREFVPVAGTANEAFLRALDAFVLTACKHTLQVIFTFFSFSPPLFEGKNPWLDPRAVEAQQNFVALLAGRYARVELLSWDLINEPSFGDPKRIFSLRPIPNYDHFEVSAFQQWLARRYTLSELQLRWRQTPADLPHWANVLPPVEADYNTYIRETSVRSMFKVADYTRFSQDIFHRWAAQIVEAIRASGSQTLIGVGQDEAGSRISPQFYGSAVDYTTTHPWWNIDDMLWDMLLDKMPDRPNLIQETGVMQLRDIDGRPWRNEQENSYLLERKLITGLIARGAGLIQWLWHTNSYMTSDNENSIGLLRPDGSAKPELVIMEEFGRLVAALRGRIQEMPSLPGVWLVIPYTQWFTRPDLARAGTQHAVRVLSHDLGILPQLVSEYKLQGLTAGQQPRAIILPAIQLLDQQSWKHLLEYVHAGGTLLVSGIIGRDTHNLAFNPGLDGVTADLPLEPVSRYEELTIADGQVLQATFGEEKISYLRKAHNQVQTLSYGAGTLAWSGLPLELASDTIATRAFYATVLSHAEAGRQASTPFVLARQSLQDGGTLILVVSESSRVQQIALEEGIEITIGPNRAGALILGADRAVRTFGGLHC